VNVATYTHVTVNDYIALQQAIVNQPISVSIDAESMYFQTYTTGVLDNAASCGTTIDHAVLAVGYGVENGMDYFLVKNSWATSWGDNGYVKIGADDSNSGMGVCGIQSGPLYPSV
jgi:C1A family cysteine protease